MPKGYWIVRVDIADPEQYKLYIAANAAPFKRYGARFLVRGGQYENPEGTSRARNAVIEFPTYAAAVQCWHWLSINERSESDSRSPLLTWSSSKATKSRNPPERRPTTRA